MFDKDNPSVDGGPGTVVGANVRLNGIIKDTNDITVHGYIDGEVISDKNILITETANVKGPVSAQEVIISGKINGSVTANKKLEITPTGKVYGSISTRDLNIKSGAHFVGKSSMLGLENEKKDLSKVDHRDKNINKDKKNKPDKYELE